MPAAARKRYPSVVPAERAHGPQRPTAAGRPLRSPNPRHQSAPAAAPAYDWQSSPFTAPAQRQLDERAAPAYESFLEVSAKARAARRQARRRHRPFRLTWQASIAGCILMAQLVALLWMQGVALSARNRSYKLDKDIADKYSAVTRTQKEIAGLDSASRIAAWAGQRGWQVASQDRLDSVTNLTPVTENETDPASSAPSTALATAATINHNSRKAHRHQKTVPIKVEIQVANSNAVAGHSANSGATTAATDSQTPHNDSQGRSANSVQAGDD